MISTIVAKSRNNSIGYDDKLLWHISEDLKRFKEITTNKTIIMGRKTFESLPKVLPNRKHIVLTRDKNFKVESDMVTVINDFNYVIEKFNNSEEEVFIIGGGEIYSLFLPYTKKLYLTRIYQDFVADTRFPLINMDDWIIEYQSEIFTNQEDNLRYDFINLVKK